MKNDEGNLSEQQKNQLIPRAIEPPTKWYVPLIRAMGFLLLISGTMWAVALWWSVAPPFSWMLRQWPKYMERSDALFETSHFGHAFLGPVEMATLGTIILSFVHVIHQLRSQNHTEMTRFQPVVICVAVLNFDIEGTAAAERIRIAHPYLRLRITNLGDSPATFIGIEVNGLYYIDTKGNRTPLKEKLKLNSARIDSLGKHDAAATFQHETELSTPKDLPKEIVELIDGILRCEDKPDPGRLELTVSIRHENVMRLKYRSEGTFFWSRELFDRKLSDGDQFEYIEKVREARAKQSKVDGANGNASIGHYIKRGQSLQAALKH